ncbi:hypothetical protein RYF71_03000 [Wolbachia endosymbiont of Drosophila malagassya]|uniref:hypothetical protein n=1 Tax=Wolbachia endosymbiont of Drosophila seguyi TaxID=3002581 RepID=UPI0023A99099|nr:hypothetical protein [Wolbachia endosymbiont of Drosophila seguyi]MDE5065533.1 hypothetical protein [Wolbachia endosymbiont of Drosophila seguyi]MDU8922433.1 hypothetical protein [Wolbachia endosymbiont of Drosophila seguyi]MDU8940996.1 hypothetical protein [Wolbachia endosymbiont of Drosophila malagassya]
MKAKLESSGGNDKKETPEEFAARIDREQAERKKSDDNDSDWTKRLKERAAVMQFSDSEEESPVPPSSCVDSPQVNNVDSVDNEVQDSPPLSVEDRIAQFGGKALRCQKENVVQGL